MRVKLWAWLLSIGVILIVSVQSNADEGAVQVDPNLPGYKKVSGVSGSLTSIGSDTMNNLMTLWLEGFVKIYPSVKHSIEGKGSGTAPPALIAGTAQLGPMSRPMKSSEIDAVEEKHGFKPTRLRVGLDGLAVYVHRDNPIKSLTLAQVDAMFSKTRKRGHPEINTWGGLGLTGDWAKQPIRLYGRNSASGTYLYFKDHVLNKGDYKDTVKEQPGSATVVQSITEDRYAAGYSGIGYRTSGVRPVPIAENDGDLAYEATSANVISEKYPISRYLNVYILKHPDKPLDPLLREFVRYIFSKEGQQVVVKDGYIPLSAEQAAKELEQIE
jgi:phosphate transport system substrate-binding protein